MYPLARPTLFVCAVIVFSKIGWPATLCVCTYGCCDSSFPKWKNEYSRGAASQTRSNRPPADKLRHHVDIHTIDMCVSCACLLYFASYILHQQRLPAPALTSDCFPFAVYCLLFTVCCCSLARSLAWTRNETKRMETNGIASTETAWNGTERNWMDGMEPNQTEYNGMEWNRIERNGMEWNRMESTEMEPNQTEWN